MVQSLLLQQCTDQASGSLRFIKYTVDVAAIYIAVGGSIHLLGFFRDIVSQRQDRSPACQFCGSHMDLIPLDLDTA